MVLDLFQETFMDKFVIHCFFSIYLQLFPHRILMINSTIQVLRSNLVHINELMDLLKCLI